MAAVFYLFFIQSKCVVKNGYYLKKLMNNVAWNDEIGTKPLSFLAANSCWKENSKP